MKQKFKGIINKIFNILSFMAIGFAALFFLTDCHGLPVQTIPAIYQAKEVADTLEKGSKKTIIQTGLNACLVLNAEYEKLKIKFATETVMANKWRMIRNTGILFLILSFIAFTGYTLLKIKKIAVPFV